MNQQATSYHSQGVQQSHHRQFPVQRPFPSTSNQAVMKAHMDKLIQIDKVLFQEAGKRRAATEVFDITNAEFKRVHEKLENARSILNRQINLVIQLENERESI